MTNIKTNSQTTEYWRPFSLHFPHPLTPSQRLLAHQHRQVSLPLVPCSTPGTGPAQRVLAFPAAGGEARSREGWPVSGSSPDLARSHSSPRFSPSSSSSTLIPLSGHRGEQPIPPPPPPPHYNPNISHLSRHMLTDVDFISPPAASR